MENAIQSIKNGRAHLLPGDAINPDPFRSRMDLDLEYVLDLREQYLLQNYYLEAGIGSFFGLREDEPYYKGWESPTSQLRGHFLGHWLSAAALLYSATGDERLKSKADYVVSELKKCADQNGGQWAAAIPTKYLDWAAAGKPVWAPHYTIHKLLMGLIDMYRLMNNTVALTLAEGMADYLYQWSGRFSPEEMQNLLDVETGGMMEAFADLYTLTGKQRDLKLMERYAHTRLFDRLLRGEDALSNQHANTTIPEVHGACRAYEVTGDEKWRRIAEAYWNAAVNQRDAFVTGGQTHGEFWTAQSGLEYRIGYKNQEHCTVYNMIRLADYLYRWTGEKSYQDYIERNLYNGVLAQCFWTGYGDKFGLHSSFTHGRIEKTNVTYFLPLGYGAKKLWATPTDNFYCCHGSAVQACASFDRWIYYTNRDTVIVNQYIDSEYAEDWKKIRLVRNKRLDLPNRPAFWQFDLKVSGGRFPLKLRIPDWVAGKASVYLDGDEIPYATADGYAVLDQEWTGQTVSIVFPIAVTRYKIP